MKINIFQIDGEKDKHGVMYQNLDAIEGFQGTKDIQSEIYDKVFDGDVDCNTLEGVYTMFNTDHPLGYVGRSLSVSDIVQVWDGGEEEVGFYFCDSFGFKKVAFDPTKTVDKSRENFITALLIKPGCEPEKVQIGRDLRSLQSAVEGDIEQFPCFADDAVIICNEEGKIQGLPLNRAVREEYELELPYCELKKRLSAAERENSGSLVGYIVFTEDSFDKIYPIEARTYMVSSNNKAFQDGMGGYSIYGSSVDGEDLCVRLDGYMKDEHGGANGWKIEKCYVYKDEKEIIDIISGNFLIVNAPLESEHYESLSFGQLQKYRKKFENPEYFVRINGEITAIPYKADKEKNHRGDGR